MAAVALALGELDFKFGLFALLHIPVKTVGVEYAKQKSCDTNTSESYRSGDVVLGERCCCAQQGGADE